MSVKDVINKFCSLTDVKLHIEEEHGKETSLLHLKMNRAFEKFVDVNKYSYSDV